MSREPTAHYRVERDVAVIELDYPPVNALAFELRHALSSGLERAAADPAIRAIVLIGASGVFCGGADLRQLGSPKYWVYPRTVELAARIDGIDKPVVAALGRLAMGGGLELALGCHYRISLPQSRLALPEVKLGLMPGGGGTLRLPRLIGIERALQMMLDGEPVDGETALQWGLVDAVARTDLLQEALDLAQHHADSGHRPRRARDLPVDLDIARAAIEAARARLARGENRGGAPLAIVECTEAASLRSFDEAVNFTAERSAQRMASDESKAYRHLFFADREASKLLTHDPDEGAAVAEIRQVALVVDAPVQPRRTAAIEALAERLRAAGTRTSVVDGPLPQTPEPSLPEEADVTIFFPGEDEGAAEWLRSLDRMLPAQVPLLIARIADEPQGELRALRVRAHLRAQLKAQPPGAQPQPTQAHDHPREPAAERPVAGLRLPGAGSRVAEIVDLGCDNGLLRRSLARMLKRAGFVPVQTGDGPAPVAQALLSRYRRCLGELKRAGVQPARVGRAWSAWGLNDGLLTVDQAWPPDAAEPVTAGPASAAPGRVASTSGEPVQAAPNVAEPGPFADDASLVRHCLAALADEGRRLIASGQVLRASDVDVILVTDFGFPRFRGGPMFQAGMTDRAPIARS